MDAMETGKPIHSLRKQKESTQKHLAEKLHVSTSTLSKRFRQETGMSPREYLEQLVISRACTLLLADELGIADVAEELGFSDQFYFAKYFKKQMHVSPSGYRRQMKMTGKGD